MLYLLKDDKVVKTVPSLNEGIDAIWNKHEGDLLLTLEEVLVYKTEWQTFWPAIKRRVVCLDFEYQEQEG